MKGINAPMHERVKNYRIRKPEVLLDVAATSNRATYSPTFSNTYRFPVAKRGGRFNR